ncbi:Immunoglobulin-like and fibronectin type III domain-containing protein 1 [Oryzias melastigma]|nr:Immunoglobulin-like and fibronectin type III domain-containing protein 1 [Oryzias melastigma]
MITQYSASLPEGKSTPDFQCKPVPVTVQEGKLAVFKAVVTGDPKPDVLWRRAKGTITDKEKFQRKYDESTGEHILEIYKVTSAESDTYKCSAVNEYGKAVCTTTLSVIDGKKKLNTFVCFSKEERADGENDEKFWDALLNAERKDYEQICKENGITDLHLILKKLEEKKRQRGQNKHKVWNQELLFSTRFVFTYMFPHQDSVIPYDDDDDEAARKYGNNSVRRTQDLRSNGPLQSDSGLYPVLSLWTLFRIHDFNVFAVSNVDFVIKIQELNIEEADNALFECVLTHPLPKITWMRKGLALEDGEKYSITVSEHKLIHRLMIRDCCKTDKGIYSAVAGITSCSAWLVVEVAKEQQLKNQKEMEKILEAIKVKQAAEKVKNGKTPKINGEYCNGTGQHGGTWDRSSEGDGGDGASEDPWCVEDRWRADNPWRADDPWRADNPWLHFIWGLSDVDAIINETAELTCKLSSDDWEGTWFRDGKKISSDDIFSITKDGPIHKLVIIKCAEDHSGKYRFEADGRKTEAMVNVKDPPRFNPEDLCAFTEPLAIKVGHNAIFKVQFVGHQPVKIQWFRDGDELQDDTSAKIENSAGHSRLLLSRCQRKDTGEIKIKLKNEHGFTEAVSKLLVLALPGPPTPPQVVSAFHDCINLSWAPPSNTGGSRILGYVLEKRKKGSNLWAAVNAADELIKGRKYAVRDVVEGMEYEFRVSAVNLSGAGESSNPSEFAFARDPKKPPGKVTSLKVTETSYTNMVLTWTKPEEKPGIQDEAKGYFVEIRKADSLEWSRCNSTPFILTSFNVRGLRSMEMYWVRVIAANDGGEGPPEELPNYVLAMPLPVRPKFTNRMKNFMVVRAGNSVRITVNFEASPRPEIVWLKDNVLVSKRVTVSNSDFSSQLLIPSSERSDSGIYSILLKNLVGQETSSTEIRVTDDPKPPGPVELEENVPGTVTVMWEPSPDEKRDDRLHYTVSKLDSSKRTWTTVADRLFNNRFTVCNIIHGREYHFRVYAKNDMGVSEPSESPTWGTEKKKEKLVMSESASKDCDLRCAPTFIVPLKLHTATRGYECYMSCAVKGTPTPHVTWYRNHVSLNTDTNYYISNTCGVCSLAILSVGPKDVGEYTVIAENSLGRAECSTVLSVRG